MKNQGKVEDVLANREIELDYIYTLSESSSYYQSAYKFIADNLETPLDQLSEKQKSWLIKIMDDVCSKREKEYAKFHG